jgi:DNA modification methylase
VSVQILIGDARERLRELPDTRVNCCVTSPPYFGLRDYGHAGQMGLEATPDEFVTGMVGLFREVRRVLRDDGTLWLNLGDSYAGSGRGGNPDAGTKQGTNRGSQSVGVLYGRERDDAEVERQRIKVGNTALISSGFKPKDLIGIPWRVAFALQADGWYLRQDIIWSKPNPMPESVQDRCTKAHEYLFLLSKGPRYHFDADAIAEAVAPSTVARLAQDVEAQTGSARVPGKTNGNMKAVGGETRNKRSVWEVATQPFSGAHFATFPPALIEPCILAGCPKGGTVLDPFGGAGTTGLVADRHQRNAILIELNPEYAALAEDRLRGDGGMFSDVQAA